MLLSDSSLFSIGRPFLVLLLAACLLSIPVIAQPTDPAKLQVGVDDGSTASRSGPKRVQLVTLLSEALVGQGGVGKRASLRIGTKKFHSKGMPTRGLTKETKIGQFHFVNEALGDEDMATAQELTEEWPVLGAMAYWKFVNDMVVYLALLGAVDYSTLEKWDTVVPGNPLQAAYDDQSFLITLVSYRTPVSTDKSIPRPTENVSLRIGYELLIPPNQELITGLNVDYIPFGYVAKTVMVNFNALHTHAEKHTEFLQDGIKEGSQWILDFRRTSAEWEKKRPSTVHKPGRSYFDEWLYVDGIMDGLWEQKAVDFPKSDWVKLRDERLRIFINYVNGMLRFSDARQHTQKRKHGQISQI
ncbi:hypothetical protein C8R42DRAFT_168447 [Lentinula raphanica]|nr:hypothetical protein C8R42DRAFT_168447 [Lentinula raphanica]